MNPEELKKQAKEEGIVHDEDVAPESPPEVQEEAETPEEEASPETEQPQTEPDPDANPPETDILQGFSVELTKSGEVRREFYGKAQNITLMLGLVKLMEMEIEQRQRLQPGFTPSAEMTGLAGIARAMQNMGNVLIQMQGGMMSVNETMKAGFNECRCECQDKVESIVDADAE